MHLFDKVLLGRDSCQVFSAIIAHHDVLSMSHTPAVFPGGGVHSSGRHRHKILSPDIANPIHLFRWVISLRHRYDRHVDRSVPDAVPHVISGLSVFLCFLLPAHLAGVFFQSRYGESLLDATATVIQQHRKILLHLSLSAGRLLPHVLAVSVHRLCPLYVV